MSLLSSRQVLLYAVLSWPCLPHRLLSKMHEGWLAAENSTYKISLLVTRHAISCHNIIRDHREPITYDGQVSAILSDFGAMASRDSADGVEKWLRKEGVTVDAVLSSVLPRALQTAFLMYPKYVTPLYAMPYNREMAMASAKVSGAPHDRAGMLKNLSAALNVSETTLDLNYDYIKKYGNVKASWSKFIKVLAQDFLPTLIDGKKRPPGSRIVVAVVSHSFLMTTSDVGRACSKLWKSKGTPRALTNQVVELEYRLDRFEDPENNVMVSTEICNDALPGTSEPATPMCVKDLGPQCVDFISGESPDASRIWYPKTREGVIDNFKTYANMLDAKTYKKASAELKHHKCWTGGAPDSNLRNPWQ